MTHKFTKMFTPELNKSSSRVNGRNLELVRGFTLIELLVVIAIIGVLSAVVLGQLNSARTKGADAQRRSTLKNMASPSVLYYEQNNNSYNGICTYDTAPIRFQSMVNSVSGACNNSTTGFRVITVLQQPNQFSGSSGTDYLCTDTAGNVKVIDTDPGGTGVTCP